jgi:hypothetical protein
VKVRDKPAAIDKLARAVGIYRHKSTDDKRDTFQRATLILTGHPDPPSPGDDGEPGEV